jgi:Flp pilus assembly protein TadG
MFPEQQRDQIRTTPSRRRRSLDDESGVAIIEFALILPLLMVIVVAILDFGRALNYWVDTTHLASEGARLAAVDRIPLSKPSLQQFLREEADTNELKNGGTPSIVEPLKVCVTPQGDEVGDPVQVSVSTTYRWIALLGIKKATTITSTATMRRERLADNVDSGCE